MSIGAALGQYILQTQFKKLRDSMVREFERSLWVRRWTYLTPLQEWTAPAEVNVWSTRQ